MTIKYSTFPRTQSPPHFANDVVNIFRKSDHQIGTEDAKTGLSSNQVMGLLAPSLVELGFQIELSRREEHKLRRPVFYGENGLPSVQFQVDGWHAEWRAGLEIEAGRSWMGNAVYRDLINALVMVDLLHLVLAVPIIYRYEGGQSADYKRTVELADALFGHTRVTMPFSLIVIGY